MIHLPYILYLIGVFAGVAVALALTVREEIRRP